MNIITKESLAAASLQRRVTRVEESKRLPDTVKRQMLDELQQGVIPKAQIKGEMSQYIRPISSVDGKVAEFVGQGDFNAAWRERTYYEVDAGRDEEPTLFQPIYNVVTDANLPQIVKIETLGPAGVVFERVNEGGETKFASVSGSNKSAEIYHYSVGMRYSEDLFMYNQLWRIASMERRFGNAHNALLNDAHFSPILTYSYGAANQTDGTALTTFKATARIEEKYARAVEAAITNSIADTTNPRRGPYVLLIGSGDALTMQRALVPVPQQGFEQQGAQFANNRVQSVIVYDGWTGTRGNKSTTYAGVTSGKAYLISLSHRFEDFQSFFKHGLRMQEGTPDIARFIAAETVWDTRFGLYCSPIRAVEEITLPVAASGAA